MNLLPQASGTRPRLACEISAQGVVAARAEVTAAGITAVARVALAAGAVTPSLKPGNVVDRVAVMAAIRKALGDVGVRTGSRGNDVTLVIPDAAVRVLLLDFDSLPNKLSEALPIVRFRLKKMLPFEADDAMISYQVMSTSKQVVRVLAVAIPRDVLSEYETAAREAGFEPGAVLPSTLACVAALDDGDAAALLVNANALGVTTAIVRSGMLLLHRSVDLQAAPMGTQANVPPAMFLPGTGALPLVDVDDTAGEWAAQEALPEHGRNPYAVEQAPVERSPYAARTLDVDLNAEAHQAILLTPTSMREFAEDVAADDFARRVDSPMQAPIAARGVAQADDIHAEIAEAVNIAAAYFEDTLAQAPGRVLCAGPLGADAMERILKREGVAETDGLRVRELLQPEALAASATSATVPRGWLAGVAGALRA